MTPTVDIHVSMIDPELPLPAYAHDGDAGADLVARTDVFLPAGGRALVPTGISVAIPVGYVGLVHPRSGLAHTHGISIVNAPGTIDSGYRGEVKVNLHNTDPVHAVLLRRGDRIAQLLIQRVERAAFRPVDQLDGTARGVGGHGSTGVATS